MWSATDRQREERRGVQIKWRPDVVVSQRGRDVVHSKRRVDLSNPREEAGPVAHPSHASEPTRPDPLLIDPILHCARLPTSYSRDLSSESFDT